MRPFQLSGNLPLSFNYRETLSSTSATDVRSQQSRHLTIKLAKLALTIKRDGPCLRTSRYLRRLATLSALRLTNVTNQPLLVEVPCLSKQSGGF